MNLEAERAGKKEGGRDLGAAQRCYEPKRSTPFSL